MVQASAGAVGDRVSITFKRDGTWIAVHATPIKDSGKCRIIPPAKYTHRYYAWDNVGGRSAGYAG